ncbi:MAG: hypothetical protein AUJ98_11220 [Bacteroidetes bacterium CG2_30_33_31]|nr:MAG: hypothetical protein AUJ98_11220 [Bacteroidetes bacterium CG2_30_33_31]
MDKDYNTERDNLIIKEYGRNVQKMVAYALSIDDEAKRTRLAYIIISVMQQINPNPSPNEEYYKKLWNHLNIIADYKFNIEFPYEVLDQESRSHKPEKVPYKDNNIRFRFYGRNMEMSLNEIAKMDPGQSRDALLIEAANQLKVMYVTWNKDIINDDLIAAHILKMTNGRLLLPENVELRSANDILKQVKTEQDELDSLAKKKKFTKKPAFTKPRSKKPAPRR